VLLSLPTVRSEAVQYNIVGTTVNVSVANVKFKVLGTGAIVNLTINDELFLIYSTYICLKPANLYGYSYSRFEEIETPKVESFENGIVIKTRAKLEDPKVYICGTFIVYNTGVIVVNITYVAWSKTVVEKWLAIYNVYPCPAFDRLKCLAIMQDGTLTELPHNSSLRKWGKGWVCLAMPSPRIPDTYLVTITLQPHQYETTEIRSYGPTPPWYEGKIFRHLIRSIRSWSAKGTGDSMSWLYILYPHSEGEEFSKELLEIGWELEGIIKRFNQVKQHVRFTKHVISNVEKLITECFNTLAMGDIRKAESIVDSISSGIVRAYRIELGTTYALIMGVPAAIIAFLLIKYTRKW